MNYLQLYDGGVDSAHVGILHMNMMNPGWKGSAFVDAAQTKMLEKGGEQGLLSMAVKRVKPVCI